ncbi:MAG: deoxyguanosinetriphosphate triphosphohydrolase [Rhodospirillaceae bacterium]|nr:MAG: deoxyguanosinetriphosphate triphosphohydrolase [Rhodospirillaceae bacterium]
MKPHLRDLAGAMAAVACDPAKSRGRFTAEDEAATRSVFQRDRDRIIHCGAFRRLKYKTQVFVASEGDTYRTRLTHSLEVAQIARSLCRFLGLNEDLAEALALAHDLGHTCFGHAGEDALQECMAGFNGFDHNAQSLRIVTKLERRYIAFDGLNLSWESLEGLVKHNGPLIGVARSRPVPLAITEYNATHDLELGTFPSAEAQIAAVSDDIAYNAHDLDDGLRAGLFTLDDVMALPLAGPIFREIASRHPGVDRTRLIHVSLSRIIAAMVDDVILESTRRLALLKPADADAVRALGQPLVGFSETMVAHDKALKEFLFAHMYRHTKVNRMTSKARRVVRDLFALLLAEPELMPEDWRIGGIEAGSLKAARRVADYIAGMTDRFALDEHSRLFDPAVKP